MSREMQRLYATDETFREVADLLFGAGGDELIAKLSPQADTQRKKAERRQAQVGLASNAIGIGAGVVGTRDAYKKLRAAPKGVKGVGKLKALKNPRVLAGGALGLQGLNLAGDAVANRVLARSAKKEVKKSEPGSSDVHLNTGSLKRVAAKKAVKGSYKFLEDHPLSDTASRVKIHTKNKVEKGFTFECEEFAKVDADKRQVFGWASIVELNGEPVVDLQGDYIDIDEIEKSAYEYVIKSRKGGEMHRRNVDNSPVHASDMIESFLVTPEKIEKMGLPESTPIGWWVGYQVNDDEAWNLVKSGKRTGFSIHGRGQRTEM